MWTFEIISKSLENGILTVSVKFSREGAEAYRSFTASTLLDLKRQIRNELARLNTSAEVFDGLTLGALDVTEDPVTPPTAAGLAEQAWFKLYRRWVQVKKDLIDTGVIAANNTKATALLQAVKDGLRVEYVDKL